MIIYLNAIRFLPNPLDALPSNAIWIILVLIGVLALVIISSFKTQIENKRLKRIIKQKEMLLKEVHHRVKNNLQTVSSLLSLQSKTVEDLKVQQLIKSSQQRVVSMAMVHEMLYGGDDFSSEVNIKAYLEQLIGSLLKSNQKEGRTIQKKMEIEELNLDIDTAIPVGLIVNEILTNALKYAYHPKKDLEIYLRLTKPKGNEYLLQMGDNGAGYPSDLNARKTNSLGLKLIYNLSRQLRGQVERDLTKEGTHYVISFRGVQGDFNTQ